MKKILCFLPATEAEQAALRAAAPAGRELVFCTGAPEPDLLGQAEVLLGKVPASRLKEAPGLRWLQLESAGTEGYRDPGLLPEGARLTCASGAYGPGISEHMLAMLLALQKRLPEYWRQQQTGTWESRGRVAGIEGSTCLVIGLGDIGSCFGKRVKALGATVLGVRRTLREKPEWLDGIVALSELDAALARADVVALCLPGTGETMGLMDRERIGRMKPGAILLNVGRGSAVDTGALVEALDRGHLAGAGLDVTDPEPLPPDHPLWRAPGALITPHISGFYHFEGTRRRIVALATENLRRYAAGEPLLNQVDYSTGYRKKGPSYEGSLFPGGHAR